MNIALLRNMGWLLALATSRRGQLALTLLAGVLAQAGVFTCALLGAWIVGLALSTPDGAELTPALLLFPAAVILTAAARWWQGHISHDLAFALIETLQIGIFDGLERAAPSGLADLRLGDAVSTAVTDADLMERFYAHMLADYLAAFVIPTLALVGLAALHPLLALALLPFALLMFWLPWRMADYSYQTGNEVATKRGALNAAIVEAINGMREIHAFCRQNAVRHRLTQAAAALSGAQRQYAQRTGFGRVLPDLLPALAGIAILTVLASMRNGIAPALIPLVFILASAALAPLADIANTAVRLGELRASAQRILALFRFEDPVKDTGIQPVPSGRSLVVENLSFRYKGDSTPVLDALNFRLGSGEMVALAGSSGMGKSTLASLLLRLRDPDAGRILLAGEDIRAFPVSALRQRISLVEQDSAMFDDTLANNIRLGRPDASDDEVIAAAKLAQAHRFIRALPAGYHTRLGTGGQQLSGGQLQRIAIARALLTGASILVLDEASSALDAESERAFYRALQALRGQRTVLMIAHRLSTLRRADRILVLDNGRIAESGSHEALLAQRGVYARLVETGEEN